MPALDMSKETAAATEELLEMRDKEWIKLISLVFPLACTSCLLITDLLLKLTS